MKHIILFVLCSFVESYLQSAHWPCVFESCGEMEEPVKKKPRHTQVFKLFSSYDDGTSSDY